MKRKILTIILSLTMALGLCTTAFAGTWKSDDTGWWWQRDDGSYPVNGWEWVDDNGDGIEECYYFNPEGYCLINASTPDGYTVDSNGAWIVNGEVQHQQAASGGSASEGISTGTEVVIMADYLKKPQYGYPEHFYVIKNTSGTTVEVSDSAIAYSADGTMLSASNGTVYALGPGCTALMWNLFTTDEDIAYVETTWRTSASLYQSVIQNLSYVENKISDGAIYQVTNNGSVPAQFVEGYALFFRNGELVDSHFTYFTDNDSEIKPGDTITQQLTSSEKYDSIEFYLDGRYYQSNY